VSSDFEREFPRIETLLSKLEQVFPDCNVDYFGCSSCCFAIDGESCALRNGVYCNGYGASALASGASTAKEFGAPDAEIVTWNLTVSPAATFVRPM